MYTILDDKKSPTEKISKEKKKQEVRKLLSKLVIIEGLSIPFAYLKCLCPLKRPCAEHHKDATKRTGCHGKLGGDKTSKYFTKPLEYLSGIN